MSNPLTAAICAVLDAQEIVDGAFATPVPGLRVLRTHGCIPPRHMGYRPSLCVVAQGAKEMLVGDTTVTYADMQCLVVTIEAPVLSQIVSATPDRPYVGCVLHLDPDIIFDVASRLDHTPARGVSDFGMTVTNLDERITASLIRLMEIADQPAAVDILYAGVMREIAYWLLTGPAGRNVARMVLPDGPSQKIVRAIHHMRDHFDSPLSVPELAETAGMSASSFHQHFKAMTSMPPLQYQKHLRLLEARRRMLTDGEKAGAAAFSVGYESVSQFSREYARMFGAPPRRETQAARAGATASA
jgi:AraC-like DNA-binding protein